MNPVNSFSIRGFVAKLAYELKRSHILIDYGHIVLWLDRAGLYNHATISPEKEKLLIAISRFSHLQVEISEPDVPIVEIVCQPSEAMDLTEWIVKWNRSNEQGQIPSLAGLRCYTKLPMIRAATKSLDARAIRS